MKKQNIKKIVFITATIAFVAGGWFLPTAQSNAEESGTCSCVPASGTWVPVGSCTECSAACASSFDLDGNPFTQKSCGEADPDVPGAKKCFCHIQITTPPTMPLDECIDGCSGYGFSYAWTPPLLPIEEGSSCSRQEDCVGGGTCGADRCFCNPETNRCKFKKDSGLSCLENFECNSNICTPVPGGEGKTCKVGGLTPPGEETPPPLTEEEQFPTYKIKSPIGEVTGPELIGRIIKAVLGIVGALALAMFVFGGFTWLTSGGSPDKIKKGKDILMWAVIGLVVIFTSYTLVDFILTSFGL
ncbi:MAG: pilin [Patescibacteria group bacterium]